jgi:hypothetical protein
MNKTNITIVVVILLIVIGGIFYLERGGDQPSDVPLDGPQATTTQSTSTDTSDNTSTSTDTDDTATTSNADQSDDQSDDVSGTSVIGTSAGGHDITARTYGSGDTHLLFVAGLHGGYGWNTIKVADRMMQWLENDPSVIPEGLSITVVPNMNPDGLETTTGTTSLAFAESSVPSREQTIPGRFNANDVDLNRNFNCNWQPEGTWQSRTVDAGSSAFSEPETQALRDWINTNNPDGAVVFYAAAGAVYSSACNGEPATASTDLMNTYAEGSGYAAEGEFDSYEVTGDAVDWMAKQGVPGISVLLSDHQSVEWQQNRAGIEAVLESYAQ